MPPSPALFENLELQSLSTNPGLSIWLAPAIHTHRKNNQKFYDYAIKRQQGTPRKDLDVSIEYWTCSPSAVNSTAKRTMDANDEKERAGVGLQMWWDPPVHIPYATIISKWTRQSLCGQASRQDKKPEGNAVFKHAYSCAKPDIQAWLEDA